MKPVVELKPSDNAKKIVKKACGALHKAGLSSEAKSLWKSGKNAEILDVLNLVPKFVGVVVNGKLVTKVD